MYNTLYKKKIYSDCEYIINNKKYNLHKKILVLKSEYFKSLFNFQNQDNIINIYDYDDNLISDENIKLLIKYIYDEYIYKFKLFNEILLNDCIQLFILFDYFRINKNPYEKILKYKLYEQCLCKMNYLNSYIEMKSNLYYNFNIIIFDTDLYKNDDIKNYLTWCYKNNSYSYINNLLSLSEENKKTLMFKYDWGRKICKITGTNIIVKNNKINNIIINSFDNDKFNKEKFRKKYLKFIKKKKLIKLTKKSFDIIKTKIKLEKELINLLDQVVIENENKKMIELIMNSYNKIINNDSIKLKKLLENDFEKGFKKFVNDIKYNKNYESDENSESD